MLYVQSLAEDYLFNTVFFFVTDTGVAHANS